MWQEPQYDPESMRQFKDLNYLYGPNPASFPEPPRTDVKRPAETLGGDYPGGKEREKEKEKRPSLEVRGEAKGRGSVPMMCITAFDSSLALGYLPFRAVVEPFAVIQILCFFVIC